jgi:hypothetical protein
VTGAQEDAVATYATFIETRRRGPVGHCGERSVDLGEQALGEALDLDDDLAEQPYRVEHEVLDAGRAGKLTR